MERGPRGSLGSNGATIERIRELALAKKHEDNAKQFWVCSDGVQERFDELESVREGYEISPRFLTVCKAANLAV